MEIKCFQIFRTLLNLIILRNKNFYFWWLYYLRQWADLLSGALGIITFGFIQLDWGGMISEKILLAMLKFYKENRNVQKTN